jgi:adenine-specific DNA-methyltransferase
MNAEKLSAVEKLQGLLRELFQFDSADLDFGIYRIMNYKRDAIEKFIQKDLLEIINKELGKGALADQSKFAAELRETASEIREKLSESAIGEDGTLSESYHSTKLGKKYLALKTKDAQPQERSALEETIYNYLVMHPICQAKTN